MPVELVPLGRCRGFGMRPTDLASPKHPFVMAASQMAEGDSKGGYRILEAYYSIWCPASAAEVLGLPKRSRMSRFRPMASILPWLAMSPEAYAEAVLSGANGYYVQKGLHDWTEDDGHTQWGPVSKRKLAHEYDRISDLVFSLRGGWDNDQPPIHGQRLVDDRDGTWALDVLDGLHRVTVFHALGGRETYAQFGDPVLRSDAENWAHVRSGRVTLRQALRIFDNYVAGDSL